MPTAENYEDQPADYMSWIANAASQLLADPNGTTYRCLSVKAPEMPYIAEKHS